MLIHNDVGTSICIRVNYLKIAPGHQYYSFLLGFVWTSKELLHSINEHTTLYYTHTSIAKKKKKIMPRPFDVSDGHFYERNKS